MLRYAVMATVEAYLHWIKAFIRFQMKKHPVELGEERRFSNFCPIWSPAPMAVKTPGPGVECAGLLVALSCYGSLQLEMKFTRSQRPPKLPTVLTQ